MERPKFERYNPSAHSSWQQYINRSTSTEHVDLAHHFVLNSIFTPLAFDFNNRVANLSTNELFIPPLSGEEPALRYYSKALEELGYFPPIFYAHDISQMRRFDTYIHSYQSDLPIEADMRFPIGGYGTKIAIATVQAGRSLYNLLTETMYSDFSQVDQKYEEFIQQETFRKASFLVMIEALQTHVTSFALLSSEKVNGFENDPVSLHNELIKRKLFKEYSQFVQFGQVVPLAIHGFRYPVPLINGGNGIRLSDNFRSFLDEEKRANPKPAGPIERRLGCPAGKENTPAIEADGSQTIIRESGVQLIAQAFSPYIHYFYNQLQEAA